jgi:hypothetical protein
VFITFFHVVAAGCIHHQYPLAATTSFDATIPTHPSLQILHCLSIRRSPSTQEPEQAEKSCSESLNWKSSGIL